MIRQLGIAIALVLCTAPAMATPPSYITAWAFTVGDTQIADVVTGPVTMPSGMTWRCTKDSARTLSDGRLVAGFSCSNDGWDTFVTIHAACHPRKEGVDDASMGLGDTRTKTTVVVGVTCKTTRLQ